MTSQKKRRDCRGRERGDTGQSLRHRGVYQRSRELQASPFTQLTGLVKAELPIRVCFLEKPGQLLADPIPGNEQIQNTGEFRWRPWSRYPPSPPRSFSHVFLFFFLIWKVTFSNILFNILNPALEDTHFTYAGTEGQRKKGANPCHLLAKRVLKIKSAHYTDALGSQSDELTRASTTLCLSCPSALARNKGNDSFSLTWWPGGSNDIS